MIWEHFPTKTSPAATEASRQNSQENISKKTWRCGAGRVWKAFLYGTITVSGGGLGGSGQSCPQFLKTRNLWRSLVVLPPGCRFKYSLQAQHQHLGVFRWPKQNGGLVMSEALMKLERAPKITKTQKTCLSMSILLNCTTFCSLQVLSFGDIQCLVWGICQKAVISRGISSTNLNWFRKHQEHYSCWWPSPCEQTAIHCRQEMIGRFRASELKPCYSSRKLLEILGNFLNPKPVEIHKQRHELCFKTGVFTVVQQKTTNSGGYKSLRCDRNRARNRSLPSVCTSW